ncbi:MAG: transketolase C-terminal domain-containing protein [Devosia sp.]|nr:transketolase C-terminal domain-containing protein [Devosia sp.]
MRTAFIEGLVELAEQDPDIWLLNADLGYSVLEVFRDRFPDRYVNVGVAEQNMIGVAAGLALSGCKVFVYSIGNFPTQRCLEQLRVDVCYHKAHVVVVAVGGGFSYGSQGYTHHAIEDLAVMRALPGMRVAVPADPHETRALLGYLATKPGPGYLRLGRAGEANLHSQALRSVPLTPQVMREGNDVAICATGAIVGEALKAGGLLQARGVSARIVSVPVLKPFDGRAFLSIVAGVPAVLTVEEHSKIGGLRDTVAPIMAEAAGAAPLHALGVEDGASFGAVLGQEAMRAHCGIDAAAIVARALAALDAR